MAESHSDEYIARKMTRAEVKELSVDERKERLKAQIRINHKKYYQENLEKIKENTTKYREEHKEEIKQYNKKYREENIEKVKERERNYRQTPNRKKSNTLSQWKTIYGLKESPEEMERIYELRETQVHCSSCNCILTRTGTKCSTDATMDHSHVTNRFRQICCRACNIRDSWNKYWVDGVFGGSKLPRVPDPDQ